MGMRIFLVAVVLLCTTACAPKAPRVTSEPREIDAVEASGDAILVTMRDYKLEVGLDAKKAGTIEFVANNLGLVDHELVIVPVDEGRYGDPIVDTESFGTGENRAVRVGLGPGTYELVCLLTFSDLPALKWSSHMAMGMRATLEITE